MPITVLVPDEYGATLLARIPGVEVIRFEPGAPWPPEAATAQVLVPGFELPPDSVDPTALPELRLVQLLTAGAERWIGLLPKEIQLSNARGAHGGAVAEWVVGALLNIYRELEGFADARRDRHWTQHQTDTLSGKRILGVGAGDLGNRLHTALSGLGAEVTLVATTARAGVRAVSELPELLPDFDAVVMMVPVTAETRHLVDAEFLARMPDGAILVNVARGPIVVTDALLAELNSGRLRAALDVTDPEPLPPDHPLWTAPGLVLTPHVAGSTRGSFERAYAVAADEIARFARGEQPKNLVRGEY
ncbi:2-hydroxyacid dehydrogenase [Nocardia inohanensis]|uniref:2-hydroxyacid dehydrogenase n=1 Tax=Nocardia inohanensis TaxID=209246 RepID=UPI00082EF891|nr:2-hydroxyacid dehydrogenase [Nocardia inohanensis]